MLSVVIPTYRKPELLRQTLAALEDIYLPYRPKRRTRGTMAKEKGLERLGQQLFDQTGVLPGEPHEKDP